MRKGEEKPTQKGDPKMPREKTKTTNEIENKVVLFVGCFESKERKELYNFSKLDHIWVDGVSFVRIVCGNSFYYFKTTETAISEIVIF